MAAYVFPPYDLVHITARLHAAALPSVDLSVRHAISLPVAVANVHLPRLSVVLPD